MNQKLEIGGLKSNYLGVKIENEIVDCVFNVVLVVNMVPSVTLAGNLLPPLLIASLFIEKVKKRKNRKLWVYFLLD